MTVFVLLFTCVFASPIVYHKLLLVCYNLILILFLYLYNKIVVVVFVVVSSFTGMICLTKTASQSSDTLNAFLIITMFEFSICVA